jgi:hypothetical protein
VFGLARLRGVEGPRGKSLTSAQFGVRFFRMQCFHERRCHQTLVLSYEVLQAENVLVVLVGHN